MSYQSAVISACNVCPTCCQTTVIKKPVEKVPLLLQWGHRLTFGGVWTIRSVVATVKTATGTSTTPAQFDPAATYALNDVVAFGPKTYTATETISIGEAAPLPTTAKWTETDDNDNLYVTLDSVHAQEAWVTRAQATSTVLVAGGTHDTDYRVEVMATFRDCDSRTMTLWECVLVKCANCD